MSIATAIHGYLAAAAATMTGPQVTAVRPGEPDVVDLPTIAYWYTGTGTWDANTLSRTQETSDWHIRVYLPAGARFVPIDGNIEDWIETLVGAIRGQLFGHVAMGGAATGGGLYLSDAVSGWAPVNNILTRIVDMDLKVMRAAVHVIAS